MTQFAISNVRISYPHLHEPAEFNGVSTGKYDASFLINKETQKDLIELVQSHIDELLAENLDPKTKKPYQIPPLNRCFKDGDDVNVTNEDYRGHWVLKASNKERPVVLDLENDAVSEFLIESKFRPGHRVDALVEFWFQNNKFGRRINANLKVVRHLRKDVEFGGGREIDQEAMTAGFTPIDDVQAQIEAEMAAQKN